LEVLGSIDFTTVEVWTKSGLETCYVLIVMKIAHSEGALRWLRTESHGSPDAASGPEPDRLDGRLCSRHPVPVDGSGQGILRHYRTTLKAPA
jgi:hypothetical protein